jgi:hypothetical protein
MNPDKFALKGKAKGGKLKDSAAGPVVTGSALASGIQGTEIFKNEVSWWT